MNTKLVIFDFDGVIVDSEYLFNEILAEKITKLGWEINIFDCLKFFSGMSVQSVDQMIQENISGPLPKYFREEIDIMVQENISKKLQPIPHIEYTLKAIPNKCIASSSDMNKILLSLESTKLQTYFNLSEIFNSQMVRFGKPNPDLFLLAAEKMSVLPEHCLVIEDSVPGLKAAKAAGMKVIGFIGGTHARSEDYSKRLLDEQPLFITDDMRKIVNYLNNKMGCIDVWDK